MAIQDKYKKQPKIDFSTEEWEEVPLQDFNSEEWEEIPTQDFNNNYNPDLEIQYEKEIPRIQKNINAFGTGGINMMGLRAPITGVLSGVAGLAGKAFGNNTKSFWENYQDGVDYVNNQNEQAKNDNSTAYHTGNIATSLALMNGINKAGGNLIGKALTKGKANILKAGNKLAESEKIAKALKTITKKVTSNNAKKTIATALAYEGLKSIGKNLLDKAIASGGNDDGRN